MGYIATILILLSIYSMLVLSANLTVGMAGLLTLCQAAFYGIGAYVGSLFLIQFNLPFLVIAAIVMLATGFFSLLISQASVRLKGNYFVIATMGFQTIVYTILYNFTWTDNSGVTVGGSYGIFVEERVKIFGLFELFSDLSYLILTLVVCIIVILLLHHLIRSPFGRVLNAIRSNELQVQSYGRNTAMIRSWAFFISAAVSGLAGLLFAASTQFILPSSFNLDASIFILCALFIGGTGNIKGSLLGAVFIVLLPELLRIIGISEAAAASLRQIIYGLTLVLVMFFRPQGLIGKTIYK